MMEMPESAISANPASCGPCQLCCEVMRVESIAKPAFQRCEKQCSSGCSVYATRPTQCREFECGWLASQRAKIIAMPRELRPDRCGVVMDMNSSGTFIAHCKRPESWRIGPIRQWLLERARSALVLIEHGAGRCSRLKPDGSIVPAYFIGIDAETNNRMFAEGEEGREAAAKIAETVGDVEKLRIRMSEDGNAEGFMIDEENDDASAS
jgi:hypothetical protein